MVTEPTLLIYSKNGLKVTFDADSRAAIHFAEISNLRGLVATIISTTELKREWLQFTTDLGRVIGLTNEVEIDETDEIIYAKRQDHTVHMPFTKSRASQLSSFIAVTLQRQDDDSYKLVDTWIGGASSPPFPGEAHETAESRPYWATHALVWGSQQIQFGTETTECPW